MNHLLIENCDVLRSPAANQVAIEPGQDILLSGNRIVALGPTGTLAVPDGAERLAGTGLLCTPGFINTHAHVPMVLFRGIAEDVPINRWFNDYIWPVESNLTEEDVYWGTQLSLLEMIESGVTTVADHYFYMDEVARAVSEAGTRAVLGWAVFGSQGLEVLAQSAEFVARWQHGADGRITTLMAPHAPYTCDDDFLRATVRHAERLDVGIHIHAAENVQQTESSMAGRGQTPIEVLRETGILERPTLIAHGAGITPADIEILAQYEQVGVAHSPKTYLRLASDITPIPGLRAAGIPVGLATDGAASNSTMNILEPLRLMAMLQKWIPTDAERMPIPEALDIAFRGSAEVLGMGERLGRIEPGYLADLLLIDLNGSHHQPLHSRTASLVYNTQPADIRTVICHGEVIYRDGVHQRLDKARIIANVRERMDRLAQRIPEKRIQVYNP